MTHTMTIWSFDTNGANFKRFDFDCFKEYDKAWRTFRTLINGLQFDKDCKQEDIYFFDKGSADNQLFGSCHRFTGGAQVWMKNAIK